MEKENSLEIIIKAHSAHRPNMDVHPAALAMVKELFRLAEITSGKFVLTLGARKTGNSWSKGLIKAFGFSKNGLSIILRFQPEGKKTNGTLVFDIPKEYQNSSENFFKKLAVASDKFAVLVKQNALKSKFKAILMIIGDNSFSIEKLNPAIRKKFNKSSIQKGFSLRDNKKLKYHLDVLASVGLFIEIIDKDNYRFRQDFTDETQLTSGGNKKIGIINETIVKKMDVKLSEESIEYVTQKIFSIGRVIEAAKRKKERIKREQEDVFSEIKTFENNNNIYIERMTPLKEGQQKIQEYESIALEAKGSLKLLRIKCSQLEHYQKWIDEQLEYFKEEIFVVDFKISNTMRVVDDEKRKLKIKEKILSSLEKNIEFLEKSRKDYIEVVAKKQQIIIIEEEYKRVMELPENIRQQLVLKLTS